MMNSKTRPPKGIFLLSIIPALMTACGGMEAPDQIGESPILSEYVNQVGSCQWPSTVHIRMALSGGATGFCTGTMLRNRVIVTAAHCLTDNPHRLRFYFGENANDIDWDTDEYDNPQFVEIEGADEIAAHCTIHPDGHEVDGGLSGDGYSGVDLAMCELPTKPGGLPEATPLTYGSCEHTYVNTKLNLKKTLHIVGTGRSIPSPNHTSHFGQKRHVTVEPAGWVNYTGKPHLKLWQPDPCADDDIVAGGDSGGSVMMEMEDGSFRLIAVLVAKDDEFNSPKCNGETARFLLATPVANYLPWIEHNTHGLNNGFDLTRCFSWEQSEQKYVWHNDGHCISQIYFTNPEVTGSKSWDDFACTDLENNITPYFTGELAGWDPCGRYGNPESCLELTLGSNSQGQSSGGNLASGVGGYSTGRTSGFGASGTLTTPNTATRLLDEGVISAGRTTGFSTRGFRTSRTGN